MQVVGMMRQLTQTHSPLTRAVETKVVAKPTHLGVETMLVVATRQTPLLTTQAMMQGATPVETLAVTQAVEMLAETLAAAKPRRQKVAKSQSKTLPLESQLLLTP